MDKIYKITVILLTGENKIVDVATSEEDFNNTTVLEIKKKLAVMLPGNKGDDHYVLCVHFCFFFFVKLICGNAFISLPQ